MVEHHVAWWSSETISIESLKIVKDIGATHK